MLELDSTVPISSSPLANYRSCVTAVAYHAGKVLVGKRASTSEGSGWQFPQGGIEQGETPKQAVLREFYEETGIKRTKIEIAGWFSHWLSYDFPAHIQKTERLGQVQAWAVLNLATDAKPNLAEAIEQEFSEFAWVSPDQAVSEIIKFKRACYTQAIDYFKAKSFFTS